MKSVTLRSNDSAENGVLYMALELSNKKWVVVLSDAGEKKRHASVDSGDVVGLMEVVTKAKQRFGLSAEGRVVSCYEAGRDGFWLHRELVKLGIENLVVDSSSIERSRRKRQAKTDRIDGVKLLAMLIRYWGGERGAWSVVRVPSVEDEDGRQLHREAERLVQERTQHGNRLRSLLVAQGLRLKVNKDFAKKLADSVLRDGSPLPPDLKGALEREYERWLLVDRQYQALMKLRKERIAQGSTERLKRIGELMQLRAIGMKSAWLVVMEFFAWREFTNRREVGACAGLTGTPYDSGSSQRDQGISKSGNRRVRSMMVEISWLWLRYQPQSKLTRWFNERFAGGGARQRRVGIVALARRLLVALWQYVEYGVIPEGAVLKSVG